MALDLLCFTTVNVETLQDILDDLCRQHPDIFPDKWGTPIVQKAQEDDARYAQEECGAGSDFRPVSYFMSRMGKRVEGDDDDGYIHVSCDDIKNIVLRHFGDIEVAMTVI